VGLVRKGSPFAAKLKKESIPVFEMQPWGEWDFIAAHFCHGELIQKKIDLVHAHTSHGASLAALATLKSNVPIVLSRRVDFHLSRNPFSKWKYNRSKKIVAISEGVRAVLLSDGIPDEKIVVIPSGIDFSRYDHVQPVSKSEVRIPAGSFVIGQVAALEDHKDQDTLLKAFALLWSKYPHTHLVIVGEGSLGKKLKRLVADLRLSEVVHFMGFQAEPLRYLKTFDLFCLSSKEEGLGTSILDAMALKVPVVATKAGGIPEMVEEGKTGYLAQPQNPASLAEALARGIKEKERSVSICSEAYRKARQFDIKFTIDKTEQVYYSLV